MKRFILAALVLAVVGCQENPVVPAVYQEPPQPGVTATIDTGITVKIVVGVFDSTDTIRISGHLTWWKCTFLSVWGLEGGFKPARDMFGQPIQGSPLVLGGDTVAGSGFWGDHTTFDSNAVFSLHFQSKKVQFNIRYHWTNGDPLALRTLSGIAQDHVIDSVYSDTTIYF